MEAIMKSCGSILLFLLSVLFFGCPARSLHPLFTEKEAVFLPSLLGTWVENDDLYTFEQAEGKRYKLVIRSRTEKDSSVFVVWSGKIGSSWYLDSYPMHNAQEHHYVSVHVFTKMILNGDTLRIATLEADWLSKMSSAKKLEVAHVQRENEIILTAPTHELQKFIISIGDNQEAFPNPDALVRLR